MQFHVYNFLVEDQRSWQTLVSVLHKQEILSGGVAEREEALNVTPSKVIWHSWMSSCRIRAGSTSSRESGNDTPVYPV
jgi:hypothetical protein